jgi:hypothetical protein
MWVGQLGAPGLHLAWGALFGDVQPPASTSPTATIPAACQTLYVCRIVFVPDYRSCESNSTGRWNDHASRLGSWHAISCYCRYRHSALP